MEIIKSSGSWGFRVDVGIDPASGKRKRISKFGFRLKRDAQEAGVKFLKEFQEKGYTPDRNILFKDFAKEWLELYALLVKPSSVRVREKSINIALPYFAMLPLFNITKRTYQSAIADISKRYAVGTVRLVHTTCRMIFKEAKELEIIYQDPSEFTTIPRPPRRITDPDMEIPKYLEKEDLWRFLEACKGYTGWPIYEFCFLLAFTGLRVGEAIALTWDDIDLEAGSLKVVKTIYNPNNSSREYAFTSPKTVRSTRVISIPDELCTVLKEYRKRYLKWRFSYGPAWHLPAQYPQGIIFPALRNPGYPTTQRFIQMNIDRIQKAMDPPLPMRIHPHLFRHTHASLLVEAGASLEQIMDRLGHADDSTTKLIYLHITRTLKLEAAQKFSLLMKKAKDSIDSHGKA